MSMRGARCEVCKGYRWPFIHFNPLLGQLTSTVKDKAPARTKRELSADDA